MQLNKAKRLLHQGIDKCLWAFWSLVGVGHLVLLCVKGAQMDPQVAVMVLVGSICCFVLSHWSAKTWNRKRWRSALICCLILLGHLPGLLAVVGIVGLLCLLLSSETSGWSLERWSLHLRELSPNSQLVPISVRPTSTVHRPVQNFHLTVLFVRPPPFVS